MRVVLITPMQLMSQFVSLLRPTVEVAKIVVMDLKFGQGSIAINGRQYSICSYDYLREAVTESHYDYVLSSGHQHTIVQEDLKSIGVARTKFFSLSAIFSSPNWLYAFVHFFKYIRAHVSEYKVFITGISYGQVGTDVASYQLPTLRCASSSQDLYYDYQIAKRLLSMPGASFKYAILQLATYSFHYDLSIGGPEQWLMMSYYFGFHDVHHFHVTREAIESIFDENFLRTDRVSVPSDFGVEKFPPTWYPQFTLDSRMKARLSAEAWNVKRYPKTVEENEQIFNDYIMNLEARHSS